MKFGLILLACLAFPCLECLKVDVYYEALCPDSIKFITNELYPGYQVLSPYLEWHLIPYGFATREQTNGKWNFDCQHGPQECYSNMAQACAISLTRNVINKMEYVNCVEGSGAAGSENTLKWCSNQLGLDWTKISRCLTDGTGDALLVENGKKTESVKPKIKFIPTVTFDGKFNQTLQNNAMKNFLQTACDLLKNEPKACTNLGVASNRV